MASRMSTSVATDHGYQYYRAEARSDIKHGLIQPGREDTGLFTISAVECYSRSLNMQIIHLTLCGCVRTATEQYFELAIDWPSSDTPGIGTRVSE